MPKHPIMLPVLPSSTPTGISYDPVEQLIYWADFNGDFYQSSLHGSSPVLLKRGLGRGMTLGVEVDFVGRNIYFGDSHADMIRVKAIGSSIEVLLTNVESPQGIALDRLSG